MLNKKHIIKNGIAISIAIALISLGTYSIIPKRCSGYIDHIGLLNKRYSLYNISNFKTQGNLFFIEEYYFLSHQVVILGIFDDDIEVFQRIPEIKELTYINSILFYLPSFVSKYDKVLQSDYHIKRKNESDNYVFLGTNKILQYSFRIKGSRYWMIIDLTSRRFVMRISTR